MTLQGIARRYASALFDVTRQNGSIDAAHAALSELAAAIRTSSELSRALASPAVPAAKKQAVMDALAARVNAPGEVQRLIKALAERDRLSAFAGVAAAYDARVMQARNVIDAKVTTAVPLSPERAQVLAAALGQATGGTVKIDAHVDPSIVGGVIARVGSLVFDGSVTRQLERLKTVLAQEN